MSSRRWQDHHCVRFDLWTQRASLAQPHCRSIAIHHLQALFTIDDNVAVVFMYCNYKERYKVTDIMEALLKQLSFHRLTSGSIELLQRQFDQKRHPPLSMLMSILEAETKTYSRVFIVVDALDEFYPEEDRRNLLEELRSLTENRSVKLMATSRHIDSIAYSIGADIKLEITAMSDDIKSLVQARISTNDMLKRLLTKRPSIEDKVVNSVVEKAQGMYVPALLLLPVFF